MSRDNSLNRWATSTLYLDTRSLSLFRIALALCLLYNLWDISKHLSDFFSFYGIASQRRISTGVPWSFFATDNLVVLWGVLAANAFFALGLLLGWHTRINTFICWLFATALTDRLESMAAGYDHALYTFLLWSIFLPLDKHWSIDRLLNRKSEHLHTRFASLATAVFIAQLILIYVTSGLGKVLGKSIPFELSLFNIFHLKEYAVPLATLVADSYPLALSILAYITLSLELIAIWLLLIPHANDRIRTLIVVAFIIFHLSLSLFMKLGWFPWIMLSAWLALIPSCWWKKNGAAINHTITVRLPQLTCALLLSAFLLVCLVISGSLWKLTNNKRYVWTESLARRLGFNQNWLLFSGDYSKSYEFLFVGLRKNRYGVFETPAFYFPEMRNHHRWRKFFFVMSRTKNSRSLMRIKNYVLFQLNVSHPDGLMFTDIDVFMRTWTINPRNRTMTSSSWERIVIHTNKKR